MKRYVYKKNIVILLLLLLLPLSGAFAQDFIVLKGIVRDSVTKEPLSFINVSFLEDPLVGTMTNDAGKYEIEVDAKCRTVEFSSIGFFSKTVKLKAGQTQLDVYLSPEQYELTELVVKKKRKRYKRKNNPAVMLMDSVIKRKDLYDVRNVDAYTVNRYQRTVLGVNNIGERSEKTNKLKRKIDFLYSNMDTSELSGQPYLPFYMQENVAEVHSKHNPDAEKVVCHAEDSKLLFNVISEELIDNILNQTFSGVQVYDNNIDLLLTKFMSPMSSLATTFYKFYIIDTVRYSAKDYVKVGFAPLNTKDLGFAGNLLVAKDSSYAVKSITLNVPPNSKLNLVKAMRVTQEFEPLPNGTYGMTKEVMSGEISFIEQLQGGYARRVTYYDNYKFAKPDSAVFANVNDVLYSEHYFARNDSVLVQSRPDSLGSNEANIDSTYQKLKDMWQFKVLEFAIRTIIEGHIPVGKPPKFDIGPVGTFFSVNDLEGVRLGVGGVTDPGLHERLFFAGSVAYGFKDEKVKYDTELEYSFIDKKVARTEFPRKSVIVGCSYDWDIPSERFMTSGKHSLVNSFKRVEVRHFAYVEKQRLEFVNELRNGLSFNLSLKHQNEVAAGDLVYKRNCDGYVMNGIETSEYGASVRFSPGMIYCQNRQSRGSLAKDRPELELSYAGSTRGFLNSDYSYNKAEFSYAQRIFIMPFGKIDAYFKAGKIWEKVPYPLLFMPATNLSYFIHSETFWLMNNMEFLTDQYVTLDLMYDLDGFILGRIPLIRELDWREFVRFKAFYGALSDKNNPLKNPDDPMLFSMPEVDGIPTAFEIEKGKPYMEVGVGLHNVLKIFQIEYIRRLNYLNNGEVDKWGVRFGFCLYF